MKITRNLALASLAIGLATVGCAGKDGSAEDENLSTAESALVEDSNAADEVDETVETGVEEPTSGADPNDLGGLDPSAPDAQREGLIKTNPGRFFTPAGCITTTVSRTANGVDVTHVFTNCTGPAGLRSYDGTINASWTFGAGQVSVKRTAKDFKVNGATLSFDGSVTWTKSGTVFTRTRVGSWTGSTAAGKAITHDASYKVTYDTSSKCITRDGSSQTTIGERSVERTVAGYKRCGIGSFGCPQSGKITVTRTKAAQSATLTLEFVGGRRMTVTRPNGRSVTIGMVCRAAG